MLSRKSYRECRGAAEKKKKNTPTHTRTHKTFHSFTSLENYSPVHGMESGFQGYLSLSWFSHSPVLP